MAEEQEAKRSRVVVETPTARREYVQSESRSPERSGVSGGTVGVIVVLAVALVTILVLLLMSNQSTETPADLAAQQPAPVPQTTIIQQPAAQQPPVIVQQPATQSAPVVVTQPAESGTTAGTTDATIQIAIDKRLTDEPGLADKGITATVDNGRVMLMGTVKTDAQKAEAQRIVLRIKGVTGVDNQITVVP